jgi:hypothetical protein
VNTVPELRELSSAALRMTWFSVPWDTEVFGFHVAQIAALELLGDDAGDDFTRFDDWCRDTSARLVSCRMPHRRLREAGFWSDAASGSSSSCTGRVCNACST